MRVEVPRKLQPLLNPSRYKGAYGGRGGAKSHFFAGQIIMRCYVEPLRVVCIREVQETIKDSVRQLLVNKISEYGLGEAFMVLRDEIRGANGSLIIFKGMQDYNAENIKSLEDFDIAWVEEAQTMTGHSLKLLRPTIRKDGSELWFSWNPRYKTDPVDKFFRSDDPFPGSISIRVGWEDNPWFPAVLKEEKDYDYEIDPEMAEHVWGGEYEIISRGAYFGMEMKRAIEGGRICDVPIDPSQPVHTAWDLGKAANNPIWCFQVIPEYEGHGENRKHVSNRLHIVDFYRPEEDNLNAWIQWLDDKGYVGFDYVPHDIMVEEWGTGRTRYETLKIKGRRPRRVARVSVEDGRTAARESIEVAHFDETRCELGIEGLKHYRREWDDELQRYKENPVKDWAEHIGSAFRYLGLSWKDVIPVPKPEPKPKQLDYVATPTGAIMGNMSVKDAVDAMIRRKRGEE